MVPSTAQSAFDKIQNINKELDQASLDRIRTDQKKRRVMVYLLLCFTVTAITALLVMIQQDIISIFGEITPTTISLVSAKANDNGDLKIMLEVQEFTETATYPDFGEIEAHLFDAKTNQEYPANMVPVYLESGAIRLFIHKTDLVSLPGSCDIVVFVAGKKKKSNTIHIKTLAAL